MTTTTTRLVIEDREPVNDRHRSGRRWFVTRGEDNLANRMIAIVRYPEGWTVYGAMDFTTRPVDVNRPSIDGLTFREANTIARLYVRTGTLYRSAPVRQRAAPRRETQLMLAFAVLPASQTADVVRRPRTDALNSREHIEMQARYGLTDF